MTDENESTDAIETEPRVAVPVDSVSVDEQRAENSEFVEGRPDDSDTAPTDFLEDWATKPCPVPWRHPIRASWWLLVNGAGSASLAVLMAIVAAVPLLNFFVLGFLLDIQGRVTRSGRVRDAFWLWGIAPRLGAVVLGVWMFLIPIRITASISTDAMLVDPGGPKVGFFSGLTVFLACLFGAHILLALARGGKFSNFFRPIKNLRFAFRNVFQARYWNDSADQLLAVVKWLEFRRLWTLGAKGLLIGLAWLVLPTALYVSAENPEGPQVAVTIIGMLLLTTVNCWLPLLQTNLGTEGTIRSGFALRTIRRQWAASPIVWMLAIVALYVLTLPLHLFRVVLPPQDAAWLVTLVFVVTIFPTRICLGYAAHRSRARVAEGKRSSRWLRWPLNIAFVGLVGFYTFLLFFTQFIGSKGKEVLFEQHAFLLPWPL